MSLWVVWTLSEDLRSFDHLNKFPSNLLSFEKEQSVESDESKYLQMREDSLIFVTNLPQKQFHHFSDSVMRLESFKEFFFRRDPR